MSNEKKVLRIWVVQACKKNGPHFYKYNTQENVLAETAMEAIDKVKAKHPECTIWSVNHKGTVDIK